MRLYSTVHQTSHSHTEQMTMIRTIRTNSNRRIHLDSSAFCLFHPNDTKGGELKDVLTDTLIKYGIPLKATTMGQT